MIMRFLRWLKYRRCPNGHWFDTKQAVWSNEDSPVPYDNSDYPWCTKCGAVSA